MRRKTIDKKYIFIRDNKICHFCSKDLELKQISLDHYLPRSKGGPDDLFNLVLSCKKCNKLKKSSIPNDFKDVMIKLFIKGVKDGKIISAGLKIKKDELANIAKSIYRVEHIGKKYTVFQSDKYRFYVKYNKIFKIVHIDVNYNEEEW